MNTFIIKGDKITNYLLIGCGVAKIALGIYDPEATTPIWNHGIAFVLWGLCSQINSEIIKSKNELIDKLSTSLKRKREEFLRLMEENLKLKRFNNEK